MRRFNVAVRDLKGPGIIQRRLDDSDGLALHPRDRLNSAEATKRFDLDSVDWACSGYLGFGLGLLALLHATSVARKTKGPEVSLGAFSNHVVVGGSTRRPRA